jgi:hypothetical protein
MVIPTCMKVPQIAMARLRSCGRATAMISAGAATVTVRKPKPSMARVSRSSSGAAANAPIPPATPCNRRPLIAIRLAPA